MTVYVLPGTDAAENLAQEGAFFRASRDCVLLWRNAPCVILGKNQIAEQETSALCRETVPVLRRSTGGGAVYHDLNNINFSFLCTERVPHTMQEHAAPILAFLHALGLPAAFSGRNDILLCGKKISGMASRRKGDRTLVHGTLLFRCDSDAMDAYLTPDADKLLRHGVPSVRARTGELAPDLPQFADAEQFLQALQKFLQNYKKTLDSL